MADFEDNFVDTGGTDLTAHTPNVGTGWTRSAANDSALIATGGDGCQASDSGADTNYFIDPEPGGADVQLWWRMKNNGNDRNSWVSLRLQDAANMIGWHQFGGGPSGARFTKVVSDVGTDFETFQGADDLWLKIKSDGDVLSIWSGGTGAEPTDPEADTNWTQQGSDHTDTALNTELSVGLGQLRSSQDPWIDDFRMSQIVAGGAAVNIPAGASATFLAAASAKPNLSESAAAAELVVVSAAVKSVLSENAGMGEQATALAAAKSALSEDIAASELASASASAKPIFSEAVAHSSSLVGAAPGEGALSEGVGATMASEAKASAFATISEEAAIQDLTQALAGASGQLSASFGATLQIVGSGAQQVEWTDAAAHDSALATQGGASVQLTEAVAAEMAVQALAKAFARMQGDVAGREQFTAQVSAKARWEDAHGVKATFSGQVTTPSGAVLFSTITVAPAVNVEIEIDGIIVSEPKVNE